ncbi:MAG TPA: Asd/ArgC dimerization domain-containing protein [Candidatus Bathyarchaeia archaeon]|nr:Asd/ArgC dimerization domain-containing protein [Candidatus Bathyarchaeia archaeon]
MNRIAIVGGGPDVSQELLEVLLSRGHELAAIRVLDDESQAGAYIELDAGRTRVDPATPANLAGTDAVVFLGDGLLARDLVGEAIAAGALVIDATPYSRRVKHAPLVVPEINPEAIVTVGGERLVACPTPAAVGLAVALGPLREAAAVRRVVTTVFEPVSQRGRDAIEALSRQSVALIQGQPIDRSELPEQLAFNLRPQAASREGDGWAFDERVLAEEVGALFGEPRIDVAASFVRAPVFFGMAQSVYVELGRPLAADELERIVRTGRGLLLAGSLGEAEPPVAAPAPDEDDDDDDAQGNVDPAYDLEAGPVEVSGSDAVHVSRLRVDPQREGGVAFWIAFDNVRKGVVLNAAMILEIALRDLLSN